MPQFHSYFLQSNRIYQAVTELNWYQLSVKDRKIYLMLLLKAQRPQILYIAGLKPLNMETGLAVSLKLKSS